MKNLNTISNLNYKTMIKQSDFDQMQLSPNCILGGFVSYIKQPSRQLGSCQLKSKVSKSLYKKTINCLYDQQRQLAFQLHYQQQLRNKTAINNRLVRYMNGKVNIVDKILTPGSKIKLGQKTNIRKVNIERKYNAFICTNLHALKEAQEIQNYKTHIRKHFDSQHQSPMVQRLKKTLGMNNQFVYPRASCHTLHKSCCASLNLTPRKIENPLISYSRNRNQYKSRSKSKLQYAVPLTVTKKSVLKMR